MSHMIRTAPGLGDWHSSRPDGGHAARDHSPSIRTDGAGQSGDTASRHEPFLAIPWWVVDRHGAELGPFGIAVYCAIARHANAEREAWPSVPTIMAKFGICRRQTLDELHKLEKLGLITVTRCHGQTNRYKIRRQPSTPLGQCTTCTGAHPAPLSAEPVHHVHPTSAPRAPEVATRTTRDSSLSPTGSREYTESNICAIVENDNRTECALVKPRRASSKKQIDPELEERLHRSFEAFWKLQVRKVDKAWCWAWWQRNVRERGVAPAIIKGYKAYIANCNLEEDCKYVKRPKTWLHGRCWEDEGIDPSALEAIKPIREPIRDLGYEYSDEYLEKTLGIPRAAAHNG